MIIKKINVIYLIFALVNFQFVVAQNTAMDEMAIIQEEWGMAKKEVVGAYMELEDSKAAAFWPVYDSYAMQRKDLGKERFGIIQDYADTYDNINNEQARDLTNRLFKNNIATEKLQLKYYKKMSKVVSPVEATKFMQLEKYIETVVQSEMQEIIPFIGEMEDARN